MQWHRRQTLLLVGAPLAIAPALMFLPALLFLVLRPSIAHPLLAAVFLFPTLALAEFAGLYRLVLCCVDRPFDILTALAFCSLLVVLVIAAYTGVFLAGLAALS